MVFALQNAFAVSAGKKASVVSELLKDIITYCKLLFGSHYSVAMARWSPKRRTMQELPTGDRRPSGRS